VLANQAIMLMALAFTSYIFYSEEATVSASAITFVVHWIAVNVGNELDPFIRSGSVFVLVGTYVYDLNIQEYVHTCIAYCYVSLANNVVVSWSLKVRMVMSASRS
jgi:hypothetical protein